MMKQYKNEEMGISLNISIGELRASSLLSGKTVFLTGASGGIGSAIARKCINHGAKVILVGKDKRKLDSLEMELGENARSVCFDFASCFSYDDLFTSADSIFGKIDCLINNAGISLHEGDFMNVTEKTWDAQFNINLKAPYFLTQAWLRYYRTHNIKNGKILMMASDTSGMGSSIPYGLTKVGIASLTRGLAKKLITDGIRINALAPGTTLTPMTEDFTHGEVCRSTTIGKRALFPQEIAEIAVFLLSDLSTAISGNIFGCSEANICFDNPYNEAETNP